MIPRLLVPLLIASQLPSLAEEEEENKSDILSRLPIGATATNVTIPSFDKFKKRASLLTAKTVVVEKEAEFSEDEESIVLFAEGIVMHLFDKEEKMNATGTLVSGKYSLENEQLNAEGKIHLKSTGTEEAFEIQSQGGIFQLPTRQGLFLGPGLTLFSEPPKTKTTMNLHPLFPLLTGLQILVAAPPPEITAEELTHFERIVAPRFIPASQAIQIEENANAANAGLTRRLAEYLASAKKMDLLLQAKAPALATAEKKKDLKEGQTSIEFDGGAYFDGDNFEMVYLGNISLQQMDMSVTCNKDLKVLFDPPPEKEAKDEKAPKKPEGEKEEEKGLKGIGEMKQLTASGNLTFKGIHEDGSLIVVKGDRAFYDKAKQQFLIRGDYLEFRQGQAFNLKAKHKDAFIEFKFDGKRFKSGQLSKKGWEANHDATKVKK